MLYFTLHNRWLRVLVAVFGELMIALASRLFIVPLGLYTGGLMGLSQLLRTFLQTFFNITFGSYDIAGILYFLLNIPIMLFAYRILGRGMVVKTIICIVSFTLFYSMVPTPASPIISDYLTACLLGSILGGIGNGLVLTCGCSGGGLDVVGLCLSKRGSSITVGRFSIAFNAFLYVVCLFLFSPEIAIYSIIYNFFAAMVLDRMHKQSINVQALVFTREDKSKIGNYIMEKLHRGVTYWAGTGAYSGETINVLCVCLSKYEIEELLHVVHELDPHAFFSVQEGTRIYGTFHRNLD